MRWFRTPEQLEQLRRNQRTGARVNGAMLMIASPLILFLAASAANSVTELILGVALAAIWFFGGKWAVRWGGLD